MGEADAAHAEVLQLAQGRFSELVSACEDLELSRPFPPEPSPPEADQGLLCAVHLLAYLLEGRLDSARFLWMRTPAPVQQNPQADACHRALAARWRRQYAEYFAQLSAGPPWDSRLQPLVAEVIFRSREELLDKIANAYKALALANLSQLLGLDAVSAKSLCEARGWAFDAEGNVSPTPSKSGDDLIQMGEAQLQRLSEYMAHLESCRI
ncbi:unnamed protein product [Effrenium voratum]|nr:unnamed protein product [Effrenium voratum]CAJ1413637.1 unnamed protein product [Effrenium voratum]